MNLNALSLSCSTNSVTGSKYAGIRPDDISLETPEQVLDVFGKGFCDHVGLDNLMKMPRVNADTNTHGMREASRLHFRSRHNYWTVDDLEGCSAVKGIDSHMHPFVAVGVKRWCSVSNKCDYYVETFLSRLQLHHDQSSKLKGLYVAIDRPLGTYFSSAFYCEGEWEIIPRDDLKRLLEGNRVTTSLLGPSDWVEICASKQTLDLDTEKGLRQAYGNEFCDAVGVSTLRKIKTVEAKNFGLDDLCTMLSQNKLVPKDLGDVSVVKGVDHSGRGFVAVNLQCWSEGNPDPYYYTEIFFQVNPRDKDHYTSASKNLCSDGKYRSGSFSQGFQIPEFKQLRALLEGDLIRSRGMGDGDYLRKC